jgi:hypothetical protein
MRSRAAAKQVGAVKHGRVARHSYRHHGLGREVDATAASEVEQALLRVEHA